jgi:DNA-binding transcriptional MerR regulator
LDKAPDAFRTISEVADDLDLPQHVLRFWETRFPQIRPMKRGGGRRFYRREDVELLRGIRHLLYGEGYTIRGVQRILKDHGIKFVQSVWQAGAPQPDKAAAERETAVTPAAAAADVEEPQRGGRLFGVLRAREAAEKQEPSDEEETRPAARPQPPASGKRRGLATPVIPSDRGGQAPSPLAHPAPTAAADALPVAALAPDQLRKLEAALQDLTECRRLLDAALEENP